MTRTQLGSGQIKGVNLSSGSDDVTGTLPPANGGTGVASPTANGLMVANGASAMTTLAPGAAGNIPISNGTSWTTTPQNPTRTGVFQFEHCNGFISWGQSVTFNQRRPFILPRTATRFRLHWKNNNFLGDASPTGSLINCVAYVGTAAVDSNGDMTGQFTATPTQFTFSSGTTITAGGEIISDWISPGTFTLTTNVKYILSVGNQTSGTTEQYAQGGGAYWYTITAGLVTQTAGNLSASLTRVDNQGYFELYIEYEFADITAPIGLIVSNSLAWNTNQASLVNRGEIDSWHQLWARASGGIAASIAVSGSTTAHYNASSPKWGYYSTLNTALDLDFILYWEAFSNDLGGTTTDAAGRAAIQASTITMIQKGQALYPNARHIVTTNAPRGDITGSAMVVDTMEYCRDLLNTWISNNPCGVDQCLDPETEITNGADPARQKREVYGDGTHRSPRGNARLSKLLPTKRNL